MIQIIINFFLVHTFTQETGMFDLDHCDIVTFQYCLTFESFSQFAFFMVNPLIFERTIGKTWSNQTSFHC